MTTLQNTNRLTGLGNDSETDLIRRKFEAFLEEHEEIDPSTGAKYKYYYAEGERMKSTKTSTMFIDLRHLLKRNEIEFFEEICSRFHRYEPLLKSVVQSFMYNHFPEYGRQRLFYVSFKELLSNEKIRDLKSKNLGRLISINGTVTKTTEVRPELLVGIFKCVECGFRTKPVEQQFRYSIPKFCLQSSCNNKTRFELVDEGNTYVDWQKIKIQEVDIDLPPGAIPRSIDVILRNEMVERAQPGDRVNIIGTLIVVPEVFSLLKPGEKHELSKKNEGIVSKNLPTQEGITGLKALGIQDLNYKLIFMGLNISVNDFNKHNDEIDFSDREIDVESLFNSLSDAEKQEIITMKKDPLIFEKLADVIAPSIYGNKEIKSGIMLMLFGGVHKRTPERIKLRGDVNICIVGDPATSKSQFLKFVHSNFDRCVYTSGKGSTAAGLTASLSRDPETGEFTLEAGALIFADNGICCIDEFDKMDEKDVVAIHEAMEQQTISLTKAGIQAQLNARCSILAAANPIMGRYDKTKNLRSNLNMPPPLMSRFDMFFVLTDESNVVYDEIIATVILNTHRFKLKKNAMEIEENSNNFTIEKFKRYLRIAKHLHPVISEEAEYLLERGYVRMRAEDIGVHKSSYRITVRQLESLIRLSEAIAKVYFSDIVTKEHVEKAISLLKETMVKINYSDLVLEDEWETAPREKGSHTNGHKIEEETSFIGKLEHPKPKETVKLKLSHDDYEEMSNSILKLLQFNKDETMDSLITRFAFDRVGSDDKGDFTRNYQKIGKAIIKKLIADNYIIAGESLGDDCRLVLHPQFRPDNEIEDLGTVGDNAPLKDNE